MFLNMDTEVQAGWLEPLIDALDYWQIAGSKLIYPDGSIQHSGIAFSPNVSARNIKDDLPSRFVDGVTGACLAIRRNTFFRLGAFDTGYWNGNEDVDLCLKALERHIPIWYCSDSVVMHHESATGPERWSKVGHNVARLAEKWGEQWQSLMVSAPSMTSNLPSTSPTPTTTPA